MARVSAELLTLHEAATNRFFEHMGVYAAEQSAAEFDAIALQTTTARDEMKRMRDLGLKRAREARDGSFRKR